MSMLDMASRLTILGIEALTGSRISPPSASRICGPITSMGGRKDHINMRILDTGP